VVVNLLPYDGNAATFVNNQIVADHDGAGGLSTNRVYELERINTTSRTPPHIPTRRCFNEGKGGSGSKPVLYLWEAEPEQLRPAAGILSLNGVI